MTKGRFSKNHYARFLLIKLSVVFLFITLAGRLVYVQGFLRSDLQQKASRQVRQTLSAKESRFAIYDRNELPLAETVQAYSCFIDPSQIENLRQTSKKLSRIFGLDEDQLTQKIKSTKGSFMWVKRNVPAHLVAKVKLEKISGVAFKLEYRRHYPLGPIASHLLGLVGIDGQGLSGVEQKYNGSLTLASKNKKVKKKSFYPKGNVQLTIDGWIQQVVEKELDWSAKKTKAKKGMVIVQEPHTGEILALATWPRLSLDPDNPPNSLDLRIPTLSDVFEPGSTFKIVVGAAALEENLVSDKERFDGEEGAWQIADITIHDHEPKGQMTFEDILVYSSNIGTAKLADRVGSERLYQYARLFGFGVYPGTSLPGEAKGMLRSPKSWSGVSKNVISFGQEVGVTAIQLAGAYSSIANGGQLMEPQIIKSIISDDGKVKWKSSPSRIRRVISPETAKAVTGVLTQVVQKGSGRNAQIRWQNGVLVAGKTGTAQKFVREENKYHDDLTLVSFCGFFPAENPKLTMVVILDEPEGRRWGGLDAAPVFRRIAEQLSSQIL